MFTYTAETLLFIFEIVGTVAFSISGAYVAIERRLDYFGIIVLGIVTATGGGLIRDLFLHKTLPVAFLRWIYFAVAFTTVVVIIIYASLNSKKIGKDFLNKWMFYVYIFDAIGLGAFVAAGCGIAVSAGYDGNGLFVCFMGLITGVGGGIIRDILAGRTPLVLRKEIYAIPAIVGSVAYYLSHKVIPNTIAMFFGCALVIIIRIFALKYGWHLPKIDFQTKNAEN